MERKNPLPGHVSKENVVLNLLSLFESFFFIILLKIKVREMSGNQQGQLQQSAEEISRCEKIWEFVLKMDSKIFRLGNPIWQGWENTLRFFLLISWIIDFILLPFYAKSCSNLPQHFFITFSTWVECDAFLGVATLLLIIWDIVGKCKKCKYFTCKNYVSDKCCDYCLLRLVFLGRCIWMVIGFIGFVKMSHSNCTKTLLFYNGTYFGTFFFGVGVLLIRILHQAADQLEEVDEVKEDEKQDLPANERTLQDLFEETKDLLPKITNNLEQMERKFKEIREM